MTAEHSPSPDDQPNSFTPQHQLGLHIGKLLGKLWHFSDRASKRICDGVADMHQPDESTRLADLFADEPEDLPAIYLDSYVPRTYVPTFMQLPMLESDRLDLYFLERYVKFPHQFNKLYMDSQFEPIISKH